MVLPIQDNLEGHMRKCPKDTVAKEEDRGAKEEGRLPAKKEGADNGLGAALYFMKGCWARSSNCFFIASTTFISSHLSSAIFFIASMGRDFSRRAWMISFTSA